MTMGPVIWLIKNVSCKAVHLTEYSLWAKLKLNALSVLECGGSLLTQARLMQRVPGTGPSKAVPRGRACAQGCPSSVRSSAAVR